MRAINVVLLDGGAILMFTSGNIAAGCLCIASVLVG